MIHELTEIREAGRDRDVVAGRAARIGIRHCIRELLQRSVVDRERCEIGEHSSEHSRIVESRRVESAAARLPAGGAVAGFDADVLGQFL